MKLEFKEKYIFWIFEYSLLLKAINSIWEIALGVFVLLDKSLKETLIVLTQNEIVEDPHSFFAPHIQHILLRFSHGTLLFISIYLVGQGIIKIFLIIGILKKKLWAYPVAIYAFFAFVFYQIYRFSHTHAPLLIVFSIFDIITILLIQHEYQRQKKHLPDY